MLPAEPSDADDEQEPHFNRSKAWEEQDSRLADTFEGKTDLLSPRSMAMHPAKTHPQSSRYRHHYQDDSITSRQERMNVSRYHGDGHPGRPY